MGQNLVTKSEFARMCQANPSATTRAARTRLKHAMVGQRIDANHPDAIKYRERRLMRNAEEAAIGLDPLYEAAVDACRRSGKWNSNVLRKALGVGAVRSKKLYSLIELNGIAPKPGEKPPPPIEDPPEPRKPPVLKAVRKSKPNPPRVKEPIKDMPEGVEYDGGRYTIESDTRSLIEIPENIVVFLDWTLREVLRKFGTDAQFLDFLKATKEIEYINEKRLKNAKTKGELVARDLVKLGIIEPVETAHIKLLTDGSKTIARRGAAMIEAGRDVAELEAFVKDQISSFIRPIKTKVARVLKDVGAE